MNRKTIVLTCISLLLIVLYACQSEKESPVYDDPAGSGGWLTGDIQEKFETLANQHGGFSASKMEVQYRFNEMFFAAKDQNWGYAKYHGDKILGAMESGFERRPGREESAQRFMNQTMPDLLQVFEDEDYNAFEDQIDMVINECNACHAQEEVEFIKVVEPENRLSPVRWERTRNEDS